MSSNHMDYIDGFNFKCIIYIKLHITYFSEVEVSFVYLSLEMTSQDLQ